MMKADLYRIFRGKAVYICVLVILILAIISCYEMSPGRIGVQTGYATENSMQDQETIDKINDTNSLQETREIMKEAGSFPVDKAQMSANANLYYFFIVIVVIVLVTDLSNSTVKNTLSSAISRKKYYFSKLFTCFLLCSGFILINNYGSYLINLIMNGSKFSSGILEITKLTVLQLPIMYGIISLLVCIGFLFRRTATFNGITLPFIMIVQMVIMGISALLGFHADKILNYEFQYIIMNLVSNPTTTYLIQTLILAFSYMVIFNLIGYYSFKKAEMK